MDENLDNAPLLFCPHIQCPLHLRARRGRWYQKFGTYRTQLFGTVQRYRCKSCGKTFSTQSYQLDYYGKRRIPYQDILSRIVATSSASDIARTYNVHPNTISARIQRMSRQSIAVLSRLVERFPVRENFCADGFESFSVSQYFPCHITSVVGTSSQLIYAFRYTTLRRKGRMTNFQRTKREALEKRYAAESEGLKRAFTELLDQVQEIQNPSEQQILLFSDDHPAYRAAVRSHMLGRSGILRHIIIPSSRRRTVRNRLFPVNYLDRQLRKDQANHVRETTAYSRNVNDSMSRFCIYAMYHNLLAPHRERCDHKECRAEVAGVSREKIAMLLEGVFTHRKFLSRERIDRYLRKIWLRRLITPLKRRVELTPKYVLG